MRFQCLDSERTRLTIALDTSRDHLPIQYLSGLSTDNSGIVRKQENGCNVYSSYGRAPLDTVRCSSCDRGRGLAFVFDSCCCV